MSLNEEMPQDTDQDPQVETRPLWVRCDLCDDFICTRHEQHAHDCTCPSVDWFAEYNFWPYDQSDDQFTGDPDDLDNGAWEDE